jgi:Ser/Thr protein kinase RdoA (MazF antagonist)
VTPALASVIGAWGFSDGATALRAPSGLIQETWFVDAPGRERLVIARLHPIFAPEMLEDLEAITAELAAAGLETPRLVRTLDGARGVRDAGGALWRALTWIPGWTTDQMHGPDMARDAAALVARFHTALSGSRHEFRFVRSGVHDTAAHLINLERLLGEGSDDVRSLGERILEEGRRLDLAGLRALPPRVAHGDLKISNVLFGPDGRARALIDLDTLGRMPLAYELGDAWRSWCNPLGEDVVATRFELDVFAAAAQGYAAGGSQATPDEIAALVAGVQTVAIELAARFCVDAIEDRYFGWDPARFPSRREHNRVRAAGQLHLGRAVAAVRGAAETVVRRAFRGEPGGAAGSW